MSNELNQNEKNQHETGDVESFNTVPLISIDDGSTGTKISWLEDGAYQVATVNNNAQLGDGLDDDSRTYTINGVKYTFFPTCDALPTNSSHFQYSDHNVCAVHHALHKLNLAPHGVVDITLTLPIKQFFKGKNKNVENIESKKSAFLKDVYSEFDKKSIKIRNISVYPEAIPALYDQLVVDGQAIVTENDYSLVADLGGTSLDVAIFGGVAENLIKVESFPLGMIQAYDLIKTELNRPVRLGHLRELLEKGTAINGRVTIDREKITAPIIDKGVEAIKNFLGDDIDVSMISYTFAIGGGSELLANGLNKSGFDCKVINNPTLALVSSISKLEN